MTPATHPTEYRMPKTSLSSRRLQRQQVEHVESRLTGKVPRRVVELVDERIMLKDQRTAIETRLKEIDEVLLVDARKAGGAIDTDDWKLAVIDSESRSIQKESLLAQGVKPTIIAKATKVTPYSYAKLTVKAKKD